MQLRVGAGRPSGTPLVSRIWEPTEGFCHRRHRRRVWASWCSDVACRNTRQLSAQAPAKVESFSFHGECRVDRRMRICRCRNSGGCTCRGSPRISTTRSSERTELTTVSRMRQTMVHGAWTHGRCCAVNHIAVHGGAVYILCVFKWNTQLTHRLSRLSC